MNKAEFKAISIIADKMNWQDKPVECVIETINQMVRNDQALGLDCCGECDDYEETLLSIATWDKDKITSTMYVNDYESLVMWEVECFKDDMGLDSESLTTLFNWEACKMNFLAPEYEEKDIAYEEYLNEYYSDFDAEIMRDVIWMNHHC